MKNRAMPWARALGVASAGALGLAAYLLWLRPWQLRWGATDEEVMRSMPGDDLVEGPHFNATRAVTVHARPERIWPWIVQIGLNRAGWYSYDWLDNLGRPSAWRILPELQSVQVGDLIPIFAEMGFYVKAFEPERWMLWEGTARKDDVSWCWGLYPLDEKRTRLVTRVRMRYDWLSPSLIFNLILDVGDIVMMRRCMLGIKERAERLCQRSR